MGGFERIQCQPTATTVATSQEFDKCSNDIDEFLLATSQAYDKEYDVEQMLRAAL